MMQGADQQRGELIVSGQATHVCMPQSCCLVSPGTAGWLCTELHNDADTELQNNADTTMVLACFAHFGFRV